jgi:hypothetical protein
MEITNKQLVIGGGIVILLLLYLKKRRSILTVTAEPIGEVVPEEIDGFGSGGGGGVIPTTLTRESIITPVAVAASPTLIPVTMPTPAPVTMPTPAPVMNLSAPTAPYAIGSTSSSAPATSTVTPEREPATPLPLVPSKPIAAPAASNLARFDGLDDYSFDGAIGF